MSSKVMMAVAASLVALACVAPGHAQAPSDQSLAEAQRHLLSREDANAQLARKVEKHVVDLVASLIRHLQANGIRFSDMKTVVEAGSDPYVLFFLRETSVPFIYAENDKIAVFITQPYGEPAFSFEPQGGSSVTFKMEIDLGGTPEECTVAFIPSLVIYGSDSEKSPPSYHCTRFVHGDHDAALKLFFKQAVASGLGIEPAPPPKQKTPPTSKTPPKRDDHPKQDVAPNAGATKPSTARAPLTAADLRAITNAIRPCWGIDAGAPGVSNFSVQLQVTTDAEGVVREAQVAPADQGKLTNPVFAAFAQRAVDATKNYQCAKLPLPSWMLGAQHQFTVRFSP